MALNAISKYLKQEYTRLDKEYLKIVTTDCLELFACFGELHGQKKSFDKQGILMNLQSLGRLHEIYRKVNDGKAPQIPLLYIIVH